MKTKFLKQICGLASLAAMGASISSTALGASAPANVQTVNVIQTNWIPRYVTNVIEVSAPQNIFVTEYRTNWVQRTLTNIVDVALTNWFTRTLTNSTTVSMFSTNFIDQYHTNWTIVAMTNWNTLTLTNWETVVVTKTNWVRQPMVNVVEVNVPVAEAAPTSAPAVALAAPAVASAIDPAAPASDALVVEVERLTTTAADNRRELKFSVRLAADADAALTIEQWRVERDDAAVLFFAQTREFKRALPPGRYKVEVRARREAGGPVLTVRRTLDVTGDAVVQR